jgi:hypothetical protein
MKLLRVDAALEDCQRHLDSTGSNGTQVEAILTAYVSAVIYAAFEKQVRRIVAARVAEAGDDGYVGNFASYASTKLVRSIKIGDLAGAAAWFHSDCKSRFHLHLDSEAHSAWDTIMSNRHGIAHEEGDAVVSNLTFGELQVLYPRALTVLDCLERALGDPQGDAAGDGPASETLAARTASFGDVKDAEAPE